MQIWICEKKNQNQWFFKKLQKLYFWVIGNKQESPSCNIIFLNPLNLTLCPSQFPHFIFGTNIVKGWMCNFMFYVLHFFQFLLTKLDCLQKNENFEYKLEIFRIIFSNSHYLHFFWIILRFHNYEKLFYVEHKWNTFWKVEVRRYKKAFCNESSISPHSVFFSQSKKFWKYIFL